MFNPVFYYRLARWLHLRGIPFLPRIIGRLSVFFFHCFIPYRAEIGDGFEVGYWGMGIVIHPGVKIGRNVFVAHGVTIGGRNEILDVPRIEDNVFIATGAKVLGDITIGNGSVIGANAVVIHSVPPRCIAVGIPARVSRENINVHDYTGWPKTSGQASTSDNSRSVAMNRHNLCVFHFVNSLEMGGSEHQMVEVAIRQKTRGHRVTVGCLSAAGPLLEVLQNAGISVNEFNPQGGLLNPRGIYQMLRLTRFLHQGQFNVVQSHDLYSNLFAIPAAWLARIPAILSCRRDLGRWWWYTPRRRMVLRWIQGLSTFVIANSQAVCDYLVQEDGFERHQIQVVRNAVDLDRFANVSRNRAKLFPQFGSEDKLIAIVANMNVKTKGHEDLIHAATHVCQSFPKARFLLIGDGPERSALETLVSGLALLENICFLGRRNDIPEILACCDLFVLPSWAEGLPNVVLEAMAAGLTIVATRVGGTVEIIDDEVSGLLVPPHDAHELANKILRILREPNFAQRLARAARERARTEFSFDRLLAELESLYAQARLPGRWRRDRADVEMTTPVVNRRTTKQSY
jgi:glycosyltransferase involved in cell wall biosynthesis